MTKFSQRSSRDAVITIFILAQKGKMALKTPFVPREFMNYESSMKRGISLVKKEKNCAKINWDNPNVPRGKFLRLP